jgi:hypothetical protein
MRNRIDNRLQVLSLALDIPEVHISIQFFIYLRAELNNQWTITESARIRTAAAIRQQKGETKNTEKWIGLSF